MLKQKFAIILLISLLFTSCTQNASDDVVATIGDKYLYKTDLNNLVATNTNKEDSIRITQRYINKWVVNQLLTATAEKNLTNSEQDITKELEETKSTLLIYKYKQKYISQKLDTLVTNELISEYYNSNQASFLLSMDIIKCVFIKINKNAPNVENIRKIYRSEKEVDIKALDDNCIQHATKYDYFNEDWVTVDVLNSLLPNKLPLSNNNFGAVNYIEQSDSTYNYFVSVKDFIPKGETAPLNFIENNIRSIILEKRKIELLKNLENNIYKDAIKHNKFTIFDLAKKQHK